MQGKKRNCKYLFCCWCFFKRWSITNGCDLGDTTSPPLSSFSPQIGNVKPETEITWSKDSIEITEDDEDAKKIERQDGELTFNIGKVSPLDGGRTL